MESKKCTKCGEVKELSEFNKCARVKDGRKSVCRLCTAKEGRVYRESHREAGREYGRWYYSTHKKERAEYSNLNKEKANGYKRKYVINNPERRLEQSRRYYHNNKHKRKEYEIKNKEILNIKKQQYMDDNPQARLRKNLRTRIAAVIGGRSKGGRLYLLTGCSMDDLRLHLESLFEIGMTWENYGMGEGRWSIDHIIPCENFDLRIEENQKVCFHYSNLQPMWHNENCSKSNRYCGKYKKEVSGIPCTGI